MSARGSTLVGTATTNWHGVARIGIESVRANIALKKPRSRGLGKPRRAPFLTAARQFLEEKNGYSELALWSPKKHTGTQISEYRAPWRREGLKGPKS